MSIEYDNYLKQHIGNVGKGYDWIEAHIPALLNGMQNEKLRARGYLFLNEVYDMLGLPRTRAGQLVGWAYDEKNPCGDNYVDFGIFGIHNSKFVNGFEKSVLLDFNVDGNILDRL